MPEAAYSTPHRLPATLGSSARRRGAEALHQRSPITTATASDATIRTAVRVLSSASAIPASACTSSRLSGCSKNSSSANCRTNRAKKNIPTSTRSTVVTSRPPVTKLRISAANAMIHISPNGISVNASGESICSRIGSARTTKPARVSSQPTALSGRRRHATRPLAANETPESVWMTS